MVCPEQALWVAVMVTAIGDSLGGPGPCYGRPEIF